MLVWDAIRQADAFCPNSLTEDEKLDICYELSAKIRRELKKEYASTAYRRGETVALPDGVSFADVKAVICDGRVLRKSEMIRLPKVSGGYTEVIYLTCPPPYRRNEYKTEAVSDGNELYLSDDIACADGDELVFTAGTNKGRSARIIKVYDDRLCLDTELETASEEIAFRLYRAYLTECSAPYDRMYIDYLLSKIAYFGQSFDVANHFSAEFNARYTACGCYFKERSAYDAKKITNIW